METINPGVFFTGAVTVALLAFAGTVGRRYHDDLRREELERATARATARAIPAAGTGEPPLTLIRGDKALAADAPHGWAGCRGAEARPRAA